MLNKCYIMKVLYCYESVNYASVIIIKCPD